MENNIEQAILHLIKSYRITEKCEKSIEKLGFAATGDGEISKAKYEIERAICALLGYYDTPSNIYEEDLKTELLRYLYDNSISDEETCSKLLEKFNQKT